MGFVLRALLPIPMSTVKPPHKVDFVSNVTAVSLSRTANAKSSTFCASHQTLKPAPVYHATQATDYLTATAFPAK
jgi:hypothetical protein